MPEPTPTSFAVVAHDTHNALTWHNEDTYTNIEIWKRVSPDASFNRISGVFTGQSYDDSDLYSSVTAAYSYYLIAQKTGYISSDPTATRSCTRWVEDAQESTITFSTPEPTQVVGRTDTCSDTITFSVSQSGVQTFVDTLSDTITFSTGSQSSQTIKTAFEYYLGMSDGTVHGTDSDLKSDNGASITSTWETVETDLGVADTYKTVHKVSVKYVDKSANLSMAVSISNDGGKTWTSSTHTVGTGDGRTHSKIFWFIKTGQFFKFKIELASADDTFQIIGMDVDFLQCGEVIEL
jgi:hypothetical protein